MSNPKPFIRLLLISEDAVDEDSIKASLHAANIHCLIRRVVFEAEINASLDQDTFHLVLIDAYSKFTPVQIIALLEARQQEIPYLVLYGSVTEISAVELLAATGDHNFVTRSRIASIGKSILLEMESANERMKRRLELEQDMTMLLAILGRSMELRDKGTDGHTQRVAKLAVEFARALKVPKEMIINIHHGALTHDCGKSGIPDSILLKTGPLTEDEWKIMRTHPTLAYEFLSPISMLRDALEIPLYHHERWDGKGYPKGLKDVEIPLAARIFSIVDSWDALTSERPYRGAWTRKVTIEYLLSERGKSFDPALVGDFVKMITDSDIINKNARDNEVRANDQNA